MSPILEISLVVIFVFWIIPLIWAVSKAVQTLPGLALDLIEWAISAPRRLRASIKRLPSLYETHLENHKLSVECIALKVDYDKSQNELIAQRATVEEAFATKANLESQLQELIEETEKLQENVANSDAIQKDEELLAVKQESLRQMKAELAAHEEKLDALRLILEESENAVQKTYTSMQVLIATRKAAVASNQVNRLLTTDGAVENTVRRMEEKVLQREAQAYGVYFLEDHYVSFPVVAKTIDRLTIEKLELDELKELLDVLDRSASELHLIVHAAILYEKILQLQMTTSEEDARHWTAIAEKAEEESRVVRAREAKQLQSQYARAAQEFQIMLESSKICSAVFTEMHANFAEKEREIFNRITELESQFAKDPDNSEKNSDSRAAG